MSDLETFLADVARQRDAAATRLTLERAEAKKLVTALIAARKRFLFLALEVDTGKAKGPATALMAKFDKHVAKALRGDG